MFDKPTARPGETFIKAKNFVTPWGKRKGETLDQIASTEPGLAYLDNWRGMLDYKSQGVAMSATEREIHRMLTIYLDDKTINEDVVKLAKNKRRAS